MNNDDITLNVATPNGLFEGTFSKTAKIEDVVSTIVDEKGLDGADVFDLVLSGEALQPVERPLVSFGLEDGVHLELVATGSGV